MTAIPTTSQVRSIPACSRMDRFSRIGSVHSPDRHDRDMNGLADSSQSLHAESVCVVLASSMLTPFSPLHGRIHRSRSQVIRSVLLRLTRLFRSLRGHTQNLVGAEQTSAESRIHVVLSDVNAISVALEWSETTSPTTMATSTRSLMIRGTPSAARMAFS